MKEDGAVRQQYKQVKFRRARKKLLESNFKRVCNKCCFSAKVSHEEDYRAGLCLYRDMADDPEWDVDLCDMSQVANCPNFTPHATADELKDRFNRFMDIVESGDPQAMGILALFYPDLAALLWVSEPWAEEGPEEDEDDESVDMDIEESQPDPVSDVPPPELADAIEKTLRLEDSGHKERVQEDPPKEVKVPSLPEPAMSPATMATLVVAFVTVLCLIAWAW